MVSLPTMTSRFAIEFENDEVASTKHSMGKIVKAICKKTGAISAITNGSSYKVLQGHIQRPDVGDIKSRLQDASREAIDMDLTIVQLEAVYSILYRQPTTTMVKYSLEEGSKEFTRIFNSNECDLMSPIVLDLPTGTGKSLVCLLSSMIFSVERIHEMTEHDHTTPMEFGFSESIAFSGNGSVSMIFVPKHLHHQWVSEAETAKKIFEHMYESKWNVIVSVNKMASELETDNNNINIVICDSSSTGPSKILEENYMYSTLTFDEFAENANTKTNAIYGKFEGSLVYGRMILCSADISKMGEYNSRACVASEKSVFRRAFGVCTPSQFWLALGKQQFRYSSEFCIHDAATLIAKIAMYSVFWAGDRQLVLDEAEKAMSDCSLYTVKIPYRPSFFERLGGHAGADLSPQNGTDRFKETYGIDISECGTICSIIEAIEARIVETDHTRSQYIHKLNGVINNLQNMIGEDCPVCLDTMESASMIQPCLHAICNTCLMKLHQQKCPICRTDIFSAVTPNLKRNHDQAFEASQQELSIVPGSSMGEIFIQGLNRDLPEGVVSSNIKDALKVTLKNLIMARDVSETGSLRVMVICSSVDIETDEEIFDGYDVIPYRTVGNNHRRVTRRVLMKSIEKFRADDGKCKILLAKDSCGGSYSQGNSSDDMSGLNFPDLQVVISVGSGNRAQRCGRLTRLSRMALPKGSRDGIYVELTPL